MNRMTQGSLCIVLLACTPGIEAMAAEWQSLGGESALSFSIVFEGSQATGNFRHFAVHSDFDPNEIEGSWLQVEVDTRSASMDSEEIDAGMAAPEWFDSQQFPQAVFASAKIQRSGPDDFVAEGDLSIKGVSRRVSVPFRWSLEGEHSVISGRVALSRLDFGIGSGEWQDESVIANEVEVEYRVVLEPGP